MPVGYTPAPGSIRPLWYGTPMKGAIVPAPGSYHPEFTGSGIDGGIGDLFGRYGLSLPLYKGDLAPNQGPSIAGPYLDGLNTELQGGTLGRARDELVALFPGKGEPAWYELCDRVLERQAVWRTEDAKKPPVQPPPPPIQPPSPPPAQPPVSVTGLHPLSPAGVRVEELRSPLANLSLIGSGAIIEALVPLGWDRLWPGVKPFAVEALRVWRRLRAKLGDSRELPGEDR